MTIKYEKKRVVVAMSGGVDSSVSAALLKRQGCDVIGMSMHLLGGSQGAAAGSAVDAKRVADQLGIPFHVVNFEDEFQQSIVRYFVDEYAKGRTPNPCACCNKKIKFGLLMDKARALGADFLATGHYARITEDDKGFHLRRGLDPAKDQSYFLFMLGQEQLAATLFSVGSMTKPQVRKLAADFGLPVAEKKESQEICFVPDNDYVRFLEERQGVTRKPGAIVDRQGRVLGQHDGTHRFTIGQRKRIGIAHPTPLFVVGIDAAKNEVIVGDESELFRDSLAVSNVHWVMAQPPAKTIETACKIRYRHDPVACRLSPLPDNKAEVHFTRPERAVTPGQAAVFYDGDDVLGGGWISNESGNRR